MSVYQTERRIEFRDTDAAGIVHFSVFFTLMESVEHEFLRSLGLSVMPPSVSGGHLHDDRSGDADTSLHVTWPRVSVSCDYQSAVRFEDRLACSLLVEKLGRSSVTYRITFKLGDRDVASGKMTTVCCQLSQRGLNKVDIPDLIRTKLSQAVA